MFPAAKWAPPAVARSASSAAPAAAVELELARAAALDQVRSRFASLCAQAGLRNAPLLSLERWRFAAKWAEEEPQLAALAHEAAAAAGGSSGGQQAAVAAAAMPQGGGKGGKGGRQGKAAGSNADPVLPYGSLPPAPEPGLVADLARSGLAAAAATEVAQQLAQAACDACARLAKRRRQLTSGKPPSCPELQLAFRRHSLELTCGGRFARVSTRPRARAGAGRQREEEGRARLEQRAPAVRSQLVSPTPVAACRRLPCRSRGRSTASLPACTGRTGWRRRARPQLLPTAASGCLRRRRQPGWLPWREQAAAVQQQPALRHPMTMRARMRTSQAEIQPLGARLRAAPRCTPRPALLSWRRRRRQQVAAAAAAVAVAAAACAPSSTSACLPCCCATKASRERASRWGMRQARLVAAGCWQRSHGWLARPAFAGVHWRLPPST